MTKSEKAYLKRLVDETNGCIEGVCNRNLWADIYETDAEKLAVIQALVMTIEPVADLIGEEIVEVDVSKFEKGI